MATMTISMPEPLRQFVSVQMKKQGFDNVSEYFRTLVRKAQDEEMEKRLEALMLAGLESGPKLAVTRQFWSELKKEAHTLLKENTPPRKT